MEGIIRQRLDYLQRTNPDIQALFERYQRAGDVDDYDQWEMLAVAVILLGEQVAIYKDVVTHYAERHGSNLVKDVEWPVPLQ